MDYESLKKQHGQKWADAVYGRGAFARPERRFMTINLERKRATQTKAKAA